MAPRLIDIGDVELNVRERGEGALPVIVLHAGPGFDHNMWNGYLDPLADRYRLIFVDLRGHGRSGHGDAREWTMEQLARDVSRLATALELGRYGVLGHSFGADVALAHAVREPGAAAATILSSAVAARRFLDQNPAGDGGAGGSIDLDDVDPRELFRAILPRNFADPSDPRIATYADRVTEEIVFSLDAVAHFAEVGHILEVEEELDRIVQPVLVLAGRHDRTLPVEAALVLAERIPDAELAIFEHSGHAAFVEEAQAFLRKVGDFLDRRLALDSS